MIGFTAALTACMLSGFAGIDGFVENVEWSDLGPKNKMMEMTKNIKNQDSMKYLLILRYQGVYFEKILKGSDISVSIVTSPH